MKSLGIVKKLDSEGRITLPIELRRRFNVESGDGLMIEVDHDRIILHKFVPSCKFCGDTKAISVIKGKNVCEKCFMLLLIRPE
jgi:AbrB family transcriptional regulator, transcriptional pleiotropic regulator of transition state genes